MFFFRNTHSYVNMTSWFDRNSTNIVFLHFFVQKIKTLHRGAFCQSSFRWIYYYDSNKSTGKETGKTHLCALSHSLRLRMPHTKQLILEFLSNDDVIFCRFWKVLALLCSGSRRLINELSWVSLVIYQQQQWAGSFLGCLSGLANYIVDTVQDFLIKLGIKPRMHQWEISIFSLNNVIVRPTKIMNRANKN